MKYKKLLEKLNNKRLLVVIVLLFFVVNIFVIYTTFSEKTTSSSWDGTIATKFKSGSGTINDPYLISSGSELAYFFELINSNETNEYFNKYYEMTNNINLNGYDFSFANYNSTFSGTLDGNGYSIFNFKLDNYYVNDEGTHAYYSLFDSLYNANIKNINIHDVTFNAKESDVLNKKIIKSTNNEEEVSVTNIENAPANNTDNTLDEEKKDKSTSLDTENNIVNNNETDNKNTSNVETNQNDSSEKQPVNSVENNNTQTNNELKEDTIIDNSTNTTDTKDNPNAELDNNNNVNIDNSSIDDSNNELNTEDNTNNTNPVTNEDQVIETIIDTVNFCLINKVEQSNIENINLYNINILYDGSEKNSNSSLFVLQDVNNNTFKNIHINGDSKLINTVGLIKLYNNAEINNIVYNINGLSLISNYKKENDSLFRYHINKKKLVFLNNYPVKSIIELLNKDSSFKWKFENNNFRIVNKGSDSLAIKKSLKRLRATTINAHDSGSENGVVYINDYQSDINYYDGLNYTYSSDGKIPTTSKKDIYNDANLVYTILNYHGSDIDNAYTGKVSTNETESEYVYYKIYSINTNGTSSKDDDYVEIELIDNPFANRPNGKTFNGWITDYDGAEIILDTDIYVRKLKVPVTYNSDVPNNITLDLYAVWNNGVIREYSNSWNNTFSDLKSPGFNSVSAYTPNYEDVSPYYVAVDINRREEYPEGAIDYYGDSLTGTCTSFFGCTAYVHPTTPYDSSTTYYRLVNGRLSRYTVQSDGQTYTSEIPVGDKISGYYRRITIPRNGYLSGYYNSSGELQTGGTCNTNGGCTYYELIQYYDYNKDEEVVIEGTDYYYLTTRDTNVIVLSSNVTGTWNNSEKPFTLTGINNNTQYNNYWNIRNAYIRCYADTRIEHIRAYGSNLINNDTAPQLRGTNANTNTYPSASGIFGNYHNLKIGRGITQYNTGASTFTYVAGGNNSNTGGSRDNLTKYRLIVESGVYNNLSLTSAAYSNQTRRFYVDVVGIYGNDYDRVKNNNNNLIIRYCASGSWSGYLYGESVTSTMLHTIVKSGQFGANKYDYAAGIYAGGRESGEHFSARKVTIEGGYVYNLIGGPLSQESNKEYNDTYIYIKGGEVDVIVGGAGRSTTYGNRIIQVTDGKINYAVFGGSNGIEGNDTTYNSTLDGDTFVYIGGNSVIGDPTLVNSNAVERESQVEAGSVFGIGNGKEGSSSIGTVNNSNVIIDGSATINKNVYGGGNYGATGQNGSNETYQTNIIIHDGNIKGSVYGGGNNNGAGSTSNVTNINISMDGGEVQGSVYGGSRTQGVIYGSTNVNILSGTVYTDVYGGGEGGTTDTENGTFVQRNVNVTIGNNSIGPTVNGSVYGGSAYGTVNSETVSNTASNYTTKVTVNNGNILNSVFGGAKGSSTYTPNVNGEITVDINNGTITNVFGGCDEAGKPLKDATVYCDGGTIVNVYGGGNKTSMDKTHVYLRGSTVTTLYGGSNQLGDVIDTNINIQSGTVNTIYGGNNEGGTCKNTNITVSGANINSAIYGGGNLVDTENTLINISNISNTVPEVYGGGNRAGADYTEINLESGSGAINITNIYGGSNQLGDVDKSQVNINKGTITNVYGGNNNGGKTEDANVTVTNGTITTLFGGGNAADSGKATVSISGGTLSTVYGGGNKANVDNDTLVTVTNGTISNALYGGGNEGSVGGNTTVLIDSGSVSTVYGGGNKAGVTKDTNVTVSGGTISKVIYGGGNEGSVGGSTHVSVSNTTNTIPDIFGAGNQAGANVTHVTLSNTAKAANVYGGSNQLGTVTTSNIIMDNGSVTNIYGGNNAGGTTTTTNITINNGKVNTVYGGGNVAQTTQTHVIINNGSVSEIYGGGNQAAVLNDTNVILNNASSQITSVYGGGNQAGATTTNIKLNAQENNNLVVNSIFGGSNRNGLVSQSFIDVDTGKIQNLYGGNNAGGKTSETNIEIDNATINNVYGGGNQALSDSTRVLMNSGNIEKIYGGGNAAGVNLSTDLKILGGTVSNNVYGGGNEGFVGQDTNVIINNANINGSAYAGGNGSTATVKGNTTITVSGNTVVGTPSCTVLSTCSVFGGGNAAVTGTQEKDNSTATVNISGATVYGNVYGGANTSKVYGETKVNIGDEVTLGENVVKGPISIKGTVFGGGEANASGSDIYDWTFVSVTKGINVNINGNNYETFEILGSIFGSGNASTAAGVSEVYIKNYGTFTKPEKNISIQRTDLLTIDNSAIILVGATDRENEYSDVLFSLSRIKELDLKNNSTLFLETGANLLEEFKSLTSSGDLATVDINEDNKTVTKNVDNRVYMFNGKILNIAKNQNITDYGEVSGMSFFGMYKYNSDGSINTGIYNKYGYGDKLDWGGVFDNVTSYVLGLHKTNHDITVDGFYTNYMDEATSNNKPNYIEPTPPTGPLYMWTIGEGVIEYTVDLVASKYSTLGTSELSLRDFTDPNTSFQILGFDYSELEYGVTLTEKNNVKKIADSEDDANNLFALSIETSNAGWLTNGFTQFMSNSDNPVNGTINYIGGNNSSAPTLLFNLHHSKNISGNGDLGKVKIQLMSLRQIDALTKETKRLIITVNMTKALYDTVNYEGAMTAGRKYDLFTSTSTNITSSSSITAYYSLFNSGESIYKPGYHRALLSNVVLPLNTKITLIDLSKSNPEYYYHVINQTDVNNASSELASVKEVSYDFSMFEAMGALNSGVYYDDEKKNISYCDTGDYCNEEFIFIIDFADTVINADMLENLLLIEIRNEDDDSIYSVLAPQHLDLTYNIYKDKDAIIDMDGTIDKNKIYNGESFIADILINYTQSMVGSTMVYDTHYFDSKLGIKITLLNEKGEVVTGSTLLGLYYEIDGVKYYPNIDGTTRIKIADKVDSAEKWIIINTGTSKIATGKYKLRFESFGSPDGVYYGLNSSDTKEFDIEIINEIYGLDINTTPEEMIITKETGNNANGVNTLTYNINYNSGLNNPNIHLKMYRRSYENIDDTNYLLVDMKDYFENAFVKADNEKEYIVISNPNDNTSTTFRLKDNLVSGTYKLEFILYDGGSAIGTVDKYIIIK